MEELIELLDETGAVIGTAPKLASHHADTPLHRAFSCYLFNEAGDFLLTKRADVKKVWPGVWTNSVCGHPAPGESDADAIARRLAYELGITDISQLQLVDAHYRYRTPPYNGVVENEICPIYVARTIQTPRPNAEEVGDWRWVAWSTLDQAIADQPADYSYWFKQQLAIVTASPVLEAYVRARHD